MGFQNPIVGGTALRIPAIQSPDFATGVSGWIIRIDGSAEFNNLVVRGEFRGNDFIINSDGIFLYSGTPAAGNLTGSWTSAAGTDSFGNAYSAGLSLYSSQGEINFNNSGGDVVASWLDMVNGAEIDIGVGGGSATQSFTPPTTGGVSWQSAGISASVTNISGAHTAQTSLTGAYNTAQPGAGPPAVNLFGSSDTTATNRIDLNALQTRVTGNLRVSGTDVGTGLQSQVSIVANVTGITGTEVVLMTIPSMTFKDGRAYRVTLWGLHQSTTASTYFLYRIRKGSATTSGAMYKGQMRVPTLPAASTNGPVSLTFLLTNSTGADITTALTWTGACTAGTGIFAAAAADVATATVEDVGLASDWPGQPIS